MKTIYKPFKKVYTPSTKQKYAWLFLHDNSQIVYKIYHLQTDFFYQGLDLFLATKILDPCLCLSV